MRLSRAERVTRGTVEKSAEDLPCVCAFVAAQRLSELAVYAAGHYGEKDVKVNVERNGRRESIEVKETHCADEHWGLAAVRRARS